MDQPIPDRRKVPKDVFCLLEIVREVNAEGFQGDLVVGQHPFPNIGSSAGCNCDLSMFLEILKRSNGTIGRSGITRDLPRSRLGLRVVRKVGGCSLLMGVGTGTFVNSGGWGAVWMSLT